ncbi:MAG: hypothetical protein Q9191_003386 [Dirinaria sp. TL-2023a]
MDPLTAFSVACEVIQVVDFSSRLLATFKDIYNNGYQSEYQHVEEATKHLMSLRDELDFSRSSVPRMYSRLSLEDMRRETTPSLLPCIEGRASGCSTDRDPQSDHHTVDKNLIEVAEGCSATAQQLMKKIQALKADGPHKKRQAIQKTMRAFREKKEIQDIRRRLDAYRNALDTRILMDLRQGLDLVSMQESQAFQNLDRKVQLLITGLSQGPKNYDELKLAIQTESQATRNHIDHSVQQHKEKLDEEIYRKRLLDSLWFEEIHSREERIADAHKETFEWIFARSDQSVGSWDNYVHWLENGRGIYWINGKAGSGKSTLMSFLCQDGRTKESLKVCSKKKSLIMLKFFFWSGGARMERSIEGLLRSLIWQILQQCPDNNDELSVVVPSQDAVAAWTERRLRLRLQNLVERSSDSCYYCFFVDGLDEFDGDQDKIVSFTQHIAQSTNVKICLSSRPYRLFSQAFASSAKLQLHDLTQHDIRKFVFDNLQTMPQLSEKTSQYPNWLENATESIVTRAQGVFLWVALAVKDQKRGIRNDDSLEQLKTRLSSLPSEVEGIYARALNQIEGLYKSEASQFMRIALHVENQPLLNFVLQTWDELDEVLSSSNGLPQMRIVQKSNKIRNRILTTCPSLLEVHDRDATNVLDPMANFVPKGSVLVFPGEADEERIFTIASKVTVNFIHRTALDFMRHAGQGKAFLQANTPSDFDPQVSYVKMLLARLRLFGVEQTSLDVDDIMRHTWVAEKKTRVPQTALCDLIDHTLRRIDEKSHRADRKKKTWPPNSHWCTRWGMLKVLDSNEALLVPDSEDNVSTELNESINPASYRSDQKNGIGASSGQVQGRENQLGCSISDLTSHNSNPLEKEPDFLTLATSHSLYRYVRHVLSCRSTCLDTGEASHLLYHTVMSFDCVDEPGEKCVASAGLMNDLLRQGGNPNLELPPFEDPSSTIWSSFLLIMQDFLHSTWSPAWDPSFSTKLRGSLLQIVSAFIERGADLNSVYDERIRTNTLNLDICNSNHRPSYFHPSSYYRFQIQLSALTIINYCLRDHPGFSNLRDICVAKGAKYHSRCTQVEDRVKISGPDGTRPVAGKMCVELSEADSARFFAIFEKDLATASEKYQFLNNATTLGNDLCGGDLKPLGAVV